MKIHPDTFGLYLMDAYKGRDIPHIIERDDGHINADISSTHRYLSGYSDWPIPEQQAISYAHGTILDLGCGAGRHSLHLQGKGHRVLAADVSPLAIQVAKERGVKRAIVADANSVTPDEAIDTVLLLGNGLGVFGTPENARIQLKRFHRFTSDYSTVIMDTIDPHVSTNPSHSAYHKRNRRRNRLVGQIKLRHRYEVYASPWFDFFMASLEESRGILEGTGWMIEKTINADEPWYWMILGKKP